MAEPERKISGEPAIEALDPERPVIAHFESGPLDGQEHVFFRARAVHSRRVPRGALRRALRGHPRYAIYEVTTVWGDDEDMQHGTYRFVGYNANRAEDPQASVFSG
ncbi:MAG TPA: hypothetical protein VGN78_14615 [Solirubrobacteraceae bacterium]|jgi:hypothetical protein|nr:hypothetical protein [Solirubrobacteraceae bacterium]